MASKTLGFLACLLILPQIPRLKITHTCKPRLYLYSQVMSYVKVNKVATSAATTRSLHATEVTCTPSFAQSALVVCRTNPKTISLIEMNFHTAERGATLVAAAGRSSRMWRNLAPVCSCGYVCVCVCVWQTLSCRSTKLQWPRAPTKALHIWEVYGKRQLGCMTRHKILRLAQLNDLSSEWKRKFQEPKSSQAKLSNEIWIWNSPVYL